MLMHTIVFTIVIKLGRILNKKSEFSTLTYKLCLPLRHSALDAESVPACLRHLMPDTGSFPSFLRHSAPDAESVRHTRTDPGASPG